VTEEAKALDWQPCGYGCGKPWRPFAGTKLIGHALCAASPERQDEILSELLASPKTTLREVADRHGVSTSVLRAWVRAALERRSKAGR
jgi:hypothetical protein